MRLRLKPKLKMERNGFARSIGRGAFGVSLLLATAAASAQTVVTTTVVNAFNDKLNLAIGASSDLGGAFGLITNSPDPANPLLSPGDPFGPGIQLLNGDFNRPAGGRPHGTRLFLRVDGGNDLFSTGRDYIFGDVGQVSGLFFTEGGYWVNYPSAVGNYLTATWITGTVASTATVNGTPSITGFYNPSIQITMTAALINDTVRFQFDVKNLDVTHHTVQLAFIEDINANQVASSGANTVYNAPLRLPNLPNLTTEALFNGGQIPAYWETYYHDPNSSNLDPNYFQGIKGTVLPVNQGAEPTTPLKFTYGDANALNGRFSDPVFRYVNVWNFVPSSAVVLSGTDAQVALNGVRYAGVGLYYGLTTLVPNQATRVVTYVGQDTSNSDLTPPLALSVTSIPALAYVSGKAQRKVSGATDPTSFPITAYVANESDIAGSFTQGSQNVNVTLTLPKGLKIADGSALSRTVSALAAGSQKPVTWLVTVDPTAAAGFNVGTQTYSVTATTQASSGVGGSASTVAVSRTVSRNIEIPAPINFTLPGTGGTSSKYRMISFPYSSNGNAPSSTFRLNGQTLTLDPNVFNILQYDSTANNYKTPSFITPGQGYWFRLTQANNANISVNTAQFKPLGVQAAPIAYTSGWHQIGDPYVYGIKFSDVQVTNTTTGATSTMAQAASAGGLISPTVYYYDTSSTNPANWGYIVEPNVGFTMAPFQAYWIYVNSSSVTLTYPFPDAPFTAVTP